MRRYDRAGNPITWAQWGALLDQSDGDYRRVKHDRIGPFLVSTIWLGLDHSWGDGPPLIFETMIFGATDDAEDLSGDGLDCYCERYTTEAEAEAGHDVAQAWARAQIIKVVA